LKSEISVQFLFLVLTLSHDHVIYEIKLVLMVALAFFYLRRKGGILCDSFLFRFGDRNGAGTQPEGFSGITQENTIGPPFYWFRDSQRVS